MVLIEEKKVLRCDARDKDKKMNRKWIFGSFMSYEPMREWSLLLKRDN